MKCTYPHVNISELQQSERAQGAFSVPFVRSNNICYYSVNKTIDWYWRSNKIERKKIYKSTTSPPAGLNYINLIATWKYHISFGTRHSSLCAHQMTHLAVVKAMVRLLKRKSHFILTELTKSYSWWRNRIHSIRLFIQAKVSNISNRMNTLSMYRFGQYTKYQKPKW